MIIRYYQWITLLCFLLTFQGHLCWPTLQPATSTQTLKSELDTEESRKVLGSSVVTSVSVVTDHGNGTKTLLNEALDRAELKTNSLGSPIHMINPDRYEFYTFDETGDLVKRLMTWDEIQGLIAGGDTDGILGEESIPIYYNEPLISNSGHITASDLQSSDVQDVHKVVESVQNVLKSELAASHTKSPTVANSDVGSNVPNWSLFLPGLLDSMDENTGDLNNLPNYASPDPSVILKHAPSASITSSVNDIQTPTTNTIALNSKPNTLITTTAKSANPSRYPLGKPYFPPLTIKTPGTSLTATPSSVSKTSYLTTNMYPSTSPFTKDMLTSYSHVLSQVTDISKLPHTEADVSPSTFHMTSAPPYEPTITYKTTNVQSIKDVSVLSQKLPSSSTALSISTTPITITGSTSQVLKNQPWSQTSGNNDDITTNTMVPSESNTLANSLQHVTTILQQDQTNVKSEVDKTSIANPSTTLYSPLEDIISTKYSTVKYKPKPEITLYHESTKPIGADLSSPTTKYKPKPNMTSYYASTRPTGIDLSSTSKYKPRPDTISHYESPRPTGIDLLSSTTKYKTKPETTSHYESTRPLGIDLSSTTKYKPNPDPVSHYESTRPLGADYSSSTTKYKPKPETTSYYGLTRPFGTTDLLSLFDLKNITLEKTTIPDGEKLVTEQYVWNKIAQTTPPTLKTTSFGSYNYTRISTTNKIPENYTSIFHEHKVTDKQNEKVTDRLPTVNYGISDFIDVQNKLSSSSTSTTTAETKPILTTFSSATPTSFFASTNSGTIHENIKYTTVTSHKTSSRKNNTVKYPTNNNRYKHPVTTSNYQNVTKTSKPTKKPISYTKITSSSSDKFNIPGIRNTSQSTPVFMQRIPTINPPEKKRPQNHTTKGNLASSKNRTQIAIMLNNNQNKDKIDEKHWQKVDSNTESYKNNIKPTTTANTIKQIDNIIQNGITAVTNVLLHSEGRISNNNLLDSIENNNSLSETLSPENRTLDEENISQSTVIIEINNHSTTPPADENKRYTNNATEEINSSMVALGDNLTIQVPTMESRSESSNISSNTSSTESTIDTTMQTENTNEFSSITESTEEGTEASSVVLSSAIVSESNYYLANDTRTNNNNTIENNNINNNNYTTSEFNEPIKTVITSNSTTTNVSGPLIMKNDKDTGRIEDIESNLQNDSVQSTENSSQMITLYYSSTQESQESRISSTESTSSELSSEEVTSAKTTTTQTPVQLHPAPHESMGLESSTKFLNDDVKRFIDLCNELSFRTWTSHSGKGFITSRSMVMSPFAAIATLAMVFLGARGSSSGQMNDFLKLDDMVTFNPHQVFQNITESVISNHIDGVASSAFVREIFSDMSKGKILDFYKERVQQYYDSHVEEINFNIIGDLVRRRTNLIVKRQTMGRIQDFLRGSGLVLKPPLAAFTANIFQTNCDIASTDGRDGEMYFVVRPSTRQRRLVPIPAVVYRDGFLAGYEPGIDATAVSLNSDSIVSTIFVLPGQQGQVAPGDGLSRLEQRLLESSFRRGAWSRLLRSLLPRSGLELQIPRFSHRSVLNLTAGLQKMGLGDIFASDKADLRGINGLSNELYLSDLIQANMFSTCGEEIIGARHHVETYPSSPQRVGRIFDNTHEDMIKPLNTPASAHSFLPLNMRPRQARLPDNPRLRFDRPFLYMVRHNPTGSILYIGRFNPRLLP